MKLIANSFSTHKEAESLADCQDARDQNDEEGRYAIADGATRSFFSKEWAALLVKHFCDSTDLFSVKTDWRDWIGPIQQKWYELIEEKVNERDLFYLTNSFNSQESAASTFIGIEFNKDNGEWQAMIVGDSCLFHKTDSEFKSYLIKKSADFTNRPEVFASFAKDNRFEPSFKSGHAKPGDILILATDALARWVLERKETGELETTLNTLKAIKTKEQFDQFVHEARDDEDTRLVNDDVTLTLISVEEAQKLEDSEPATPSKLQTEELTQQQKDTLERILFWGILAGVFGFFVGFLILLLTLFNKK